MFKGGPGHASTLCYSLKSKEQKKDKLWDEAQECIYIYIYIYIYTLHTHVCMYVCLSVSNEIKKDRKGYML